MHSLQSWGALLTTSTRFLYAHNPSVDMQPSPDMFDKSVMGPISSAAQLLPHNFLPHVRIAPVFAATSTVIFKKQPDKSLKTWMAYGAMEIDLGCGYCPDSEASVCHLVYYCHGAWWTQPAWYNCEFLRLHSLTDLEKSSFPRTKKRDAGTSWTTWARPRVVTIRTSLITSSPPDLGVQTLHTRALALTLHRRNFLVLMGFTLWPRKCPCNLFSCVLGLGRNAPTATRRQSTPWTSFGFST